MIDNYIYLYHIDQFVVIPTFPENLTDTISVKFNSSTPMSRSAPIYSYSNSGPRSFQIDLNLHRDMMHEINYGVSNMKVETGDDYVDTMIRHLQAAALPSYGKSNKMVDPPMVAVRFGQELFIKGVVNGAVTVSYSLPILSNDKYASVSIGFTIEEVDPYDANQVMKDGSFRGLDETLERNIWKRRG